MQNLFAPSAPAPSGRSNGNGTTILSFKAGRMNLDGPKPSGNYGVTADKRRGTCSLVCTNDNLLHLKVSPWHQSAVSESPISIEGLFSEEEHLNTSANVKITNETCETC